MDSQQLKAFICIAECGSFSKAEEKFFLSKQSLIRQMNALEVEVGAKLIIRNSQGIILTDAGKTFYEGAKELMSHVEQIMKKSRSIDNFGKLTLLMNQDYIATPFTHIIHQFVKKYPQIPIKHIEISNSQCIQSILDHKLSLWFCYYQPNLDVAGLKYTHLFYDTLWCVMNEENPLTLKKEIDLDDIRNHQLYVGSNYWADRINETFHGELKYGVQTHLPTISAYTKVCVEDGIILADKWKSDHLPGLAARPLRTDLKFSYGIVSLQDSEKAVDLFIEIALSCISQYPH